MNEHISTVQAGNAEFKLVQEPPPNEETMQMENTTEKEQEGQPNPNFLQQTLRIHDDNTVSTFRPTKKDDTSMDSGIPVNNIPQIPSEVTPSTMLQITVMALSP